MPHLVLLALAAASTLNAEDVQSRIRKRLPALTRWASDPVIVAAVRRASRNERSLQEIRRIDRRWQATSGVDDFMRSLLTNVCAQRLRELGRNYPELGEAFVTDRLGANLAMTNKTSDFWQGDEDKFTKAIAAGRNEFHVEPVSFDESIQAYAVQVSLPVRDAGRAIGVLVVTINLEKLDEP